jgi:hypothetical protein
MTRPGYQHTETVTVVVVKIELFSEFLV